MLHVAIHCCGLDDTTVVLDVVKADVEEMMAAVHAAMVRAEVFMVYIVVLNGCNVMKERDVVRERVMISDM